MSAFLMWDNGAQSLVFDIITQETQTKSCMITEHPVEDGASITDHVRPNLDHVTLEGFISQTPVYSADGKVDQIVLDIPDVPMPIGLNSLVNAIGSLLSGKNQFVATVMDFDSAPDFVAQTLSILDDLRLKAILVTVVCPSRVYEKMLIESCEVTRDPDSGTGATFTIELREIRTVVSSIVSAPKPTIPRANINQEKGAQAAEKATDIKSLLAAGRDFLSAK